MGKLNDKLSSDVFGHSRPAKPSKEDKLKLYHYAGCRHSSVIRTAIDRLGLNVELCDIFDDFRHYDKLTKARGRAIVPALQVTSAIGENKWVIYPNNIVSYIEFRFA